MNKNLKPDILKVDPNSVNATKEWSHWFRTFHNFITSIEPEVSEVDKLKILINHISADIDDYISNCETYNDAIKTLESVYIKPINEIFARHKLSTRCQLPEESIDQYLQALKLLGKDCQFKAVTADKNRDDYIRDSFISGLQSTDIRQRLLEKCNLTLENAYEQARSLELAYHQSLSFCPSASINTVSSGENMSTSQLPKSAHNVQQTENCQIQSKHSTMSENTIAAINQKCYFCGNIRHPRIKCPAKNIICHSCGKEGHFAKVCRSLPDKTVKVKGKVYNEITGSVYQTASVGGLAKSTVCATIDDKNVQALVDTGSTLSFIDEKIAKELHLRVLPSDGKVSMASMSMMTNIKGQCKVKLKVLDHIYNNATLLVLSNMCANIIIGHDILKQHESVQLEFGGNRNPLKICSVAVACVQPASLFVNLKADCNPIAIKSQRHSTDDLKFIENEVCQLLRADIIEPSVSPWRAQPLVISSDNHRKRMVIDYSRTINRFTLLDAYPLPRIEDIVNKVANNKVFSTVDLKSAYHQIPIRDEDKQYTAFEACGQLYQFKRIPFGVTNGVAAFQRVIDEIIRIENLRETYTYLDDVTVCGKTQAEHDENLKRFLQVAKKYNLTINEEKSSFSTTSINLLGYLITHKTIRPDPSRLDPLNNLPPPKNVATLRRTLGMFSHYASLISQFSTKVAPLARCSFPLNQEALNAFTSLKGEIKKAVLTSVDPDIPFTVETDASEHALAATLSQSGQPVAFFSRILSGSELKHSSVEKEAQAIVEALRKWRHFLIGNHFKLITDQRSVSFMLDNTKHGKVKNDKIMRWRLELSCFNYDIIYRPGKDNLAADAFSRICSVILDPVKKLLELHSTLCHPGVTRLYHYVKSKNLPYSLEEVRRVSSSCTVCAQIKPRFYKHQGTLIKATSPFERLNVDFKGPLPTISRNRYLLVIIDEYSRFPFAFPCPDMSSLTVINHMKQLFSLFGTPAYIHSDQGSSFMSQELKTFLNNYGIATSRTTAYNPQCNGQVERYNGIIWKTIELALKTENLPITRWESVLERALHSVRSLLCTSTNATPHERMFIHPRRTGTGQSAPSWLLNPGPVLLKRNVRSSKYEPLVEEVTLLHGNAEYAHIQYADKREATVSTRHLAPIGKLSLNDPTPDNQNETAIGSNPGSNQEVDGPRREGIQDIEESEAVSQEIIIEKPQGVLVNNSPQVCKRHSDRQKYRPRYLKDYVT